MDTRKSIKNVKEEQLEIEDDQAIKRLMKMEESKVVVVEPLSVEGSVLEQKVNQVSIIALIDFICPNVSRNTKESANFF